MSVQVAPRAASSWAQGKIVEPQELKKLRKKKASPATYVICHECKKTGIHKGYGLCSRCYGQWRRANLMWGKCSVCKERKERVLQTLNPPVCARCHTARTRAAERARMAVDPDYAAQVRAVRLKHAKKYREAHREERRAYDRQHKAAITRDPERGDAKRASARSRYRERTAALTEEELAERRRRQGAAHQRRRKRPAVGDLIALLQLRAEALVNEAARLGREAHEARLAVKVTKLPGHSLGVAAPQQQARKGRKPRGGAHPGVRSRLGPPKLETPTVAPVAGGFNHVAARPVPIRKAYRKLRVDKLAS